MNAARLGLVCAASLAGFLACALPRLPAPSAPQASPVRVDGLDVGVARIDVTPPPGPSTFGHGPDALATEGYWSRLYCRAFVFDPQTSHEPFAIIPCDLPAISRLLQRTVVEKLDKNVNVRRSIPASRLMITATHTHAGPAHYFENEAYGTVLSTRLPGFDPAMVDFLASRIADGVADALQHLRPATIRWHHDELWGLTHNRSLLAYEQNPAPARYPDGGELTKELHRAPMLEEQAIDPHVDVMEIDQLTPDGAQHVGPLGTLTFFAMHPTVLPAHNRLFGADAFGVASREIERAMRERGGTSDRIPDPLAGIVNTNEGDLVPNWTIGNTGDCIRVGKRLGAKVLDMIDDSKAKSPDKRVPWQPHVLTGIRYVEDHMPRATLTGGSLCESGVLGQGSSHGGADHTCSIDMLAPSPPETTDAGPQAPKAPLLGPLQNYLVRPEGFEEDIPMALARLGDTWIAFVPAELTMTAGKLVTDRILMHQLVPAGETSDPGAHAVIAGLANAYIQYVTTAAEYQLQAYEGASDLYGPNTAEYLAERFDGLAAELVQPSGTGRFDAAYASRYEPPPERSRLPRPGDSTRIDKVYPRRSFGLCRVPGVQPIALCYTWADAGPSEVALVHAPWIRLVGADGASVCVNRGTTCEYVDDRGLDFQTRVHDELPHSTGAWIWSTLFTPSQPEWDDLHERGTRIAIRASTPQGQLTSVDSPPFDLKDPPRLCNWAEVRNCTMP